VVRQGRAGICNSCKKEIAGQLFIDYCTKCGKKIHRAYANYQLATKYSAHLVNDTFLECSSCDELGEPNCIPCSKETKQKG